MIIQDKEDIALDRLLVLYSDRKIEKIEDDLYSEYNPKIMRLIEEHQIFEDIILDFIGIARMIKGIKKEKKK
jgi:hypothetical protein